MLIFYSKSSRSKNVVHKFLFSTSEHTAGGGVRAKDPIFFRRFASITFLISPFFCGASRRSKKKPLALPTFQNTSPILGRQQEFLHFNFPQFFSPCFPPLRSNILLIHFFLLKPLNFSIFTFLKSPKVHRISIIPVDVFHPIGSFDPAGQIRRGPWVVPTTCPVAFGERIAYFCSFSISFQTSTLWGDGDPLQPGEAGIPSNYFFWCL